MNKGWPNEVIFRFMNIRYAGCNNPLFYVSMDDNDYEFVMLNNIWHFHILNLNARRNISIYEQEIEQRGC